MRRRTVGVIATGILLACLAGGLVAAQDKPPDGSMEALREKLRTDKRAVVASVLALNEQEGKAFWPVYNAYQSDMVTHYDKLMKLIDTYSSAYDAMTDEMATKLLTDYMNLEKEQTALLGSYVARFRKVLPPKKVARLYQ